MNPYLLRCQPWYLKWPVGLVLLAGLLWTNLEIQGQPQAGEPVRAEFITSLILLIGVLVVQELMRPKPEFEDARPGGIGDFRFVTATEGRVVPLIWGRVKLDGPNCVWYGDVEAEPIQEEVRTGWFSKERFVSGYKYNVGVQFALCRGPGVELVRVWLGQDNKHLVYDGTVSGILTGEDRFDIDNAQLHFPRDGGVQATCDFYHGSPTQTVNAYLDDADRQRPAPLTSAPRYSGTCYVVARELTSAAPSASNKGAYLGDSTNVDTWSFELQRFPGIFSGQSNGDEVVPASTGVDCNPMNVIYEILTNREWGLGFLAGELDVGPGSSFLSASVTLESEGNGWAFVLDKSMQATELLAEVERQIDGVVYLDQSTGLWTIKLARADYTVATLPELNEDNCEFKDYSKSTWEDTINQIMVKFNKRDDDYKESYAVAQDEANILMQGAGTVATGRIVAGKLAFPGCKLPALASTLVWRALRTRAFPLSRATFLVNREFWDLTPGGVFKWSNTELGISELPMRIISMDFGRLVENKITIVAVQDIFRHADPSFGEPGGTNWTEPSQTPVAYPADEQVAFEAPRAMVVREPDYAGEENVSKIFAAARRQAGEVNFDITERHSSGTPSGSFAVAGTVSGFMRIGSLKSDLSPGSAYPLSTLLIETTPDSQTDLEEVFQDGTSPSTLGTQLTQVLLINSEFMLVEGAQVSGLDVQLDNVYRGVFDTAQEEHTAGDDVYLVFVGAALSDTNIPSTENVHVRLLPRTLSAQLASGSANQINMTMAKRTIRPYLPSAIQYNASGTNYGTPDLEGDGSGLNGFGVDVDWLRRRYDAGDEVAALDQDTDPDDAPNVSNTQYEVEIRHTPFGASDIVATKSFAAGSGISSIFLRTEILDGSPNTAVQDLEFRIRARHDITGSWYNETQLGSRYDLIHRVTPTSTLTGQTAMGKATWSNPLPTAHVAAATGTYTINIGAAFSTGNVQYRLNGGSWVTSFAAGLTTGTIPGVTATDTIELRHDANDGAQLNFVELQNPSATPVAYGIFQS